MLDLPQMRRPRKVRLQRKANLPLPYSECQMALAKSLKF